MTKGAKTETPRTWVTTNNFLHLVLNDLNERDTSGRLPSTRTVHSQPESGTDYPLPRPLPCRRDGTHPLSTRSQGDTRLRVQGKVPHPETISTGNLTRREEEKRRGRTSPAE